MMAFVVASLIVCWQEENRSAPQLEKASQLLAAGDMEGSLAEIEKATGQDASLPPASVLFATLLFKHRHMTAGRAVLERAAVERPDHPEVYATLGRLALAEGRLTDSNLNFERAAALAGSDRWPEKFRKSFLTSAHSGLASVAERRGDWKTAYSSLYVLKELQPESALQYRYARALFMIGKIDDAKKLISTLTAADSKLPSFELTLGDMHLQKNDVEKAKEWYLAASKKSNDAFRAHSALARIAISRSETEVAADHARKAVELNPQDAAARQLLIQVARQAKDFAAAKQVADAWLASDPTNWSAINQSALIAVESSDASQKSAALESAKANLAKRPQSGEALTTLGWIQFRLDQIEEADRSLRAALFNADANADTAYYLALVLERKGDKPAALRLAKRATSSTGILIDRLDAKEMVDRLSKETASK